jgi:hypothetical protein
MNLKYRIKEIVDGNSNHWYYPQIKKWYGWRTLKEVHYTPQFNEYYTPYKLDKKSKAKEIIDRDYTIRMSKVIKEINYSNYTPISVELDNIFKNFGK